MYCKYTANPGHHQVQYPPVINSVRPIGHTDMDAYAAKKQALSSTLICMPQQRNTANRIFGGFLMRRAYEVAFCAAFMFGGSRPQFSEIDEVHYE